MTVALRRVSTQTDSKPAVKIKGDKSVGIDHFERCAATFQTELTMCMNGAGNQFPVSVAMGEQALDWLTGAKKDKRITEVVDQVLGDGARECVALMDHYTFGNRSNVGSPVSLHGVVDKVLNEE